MDAPRPITPPGWYDDGHGQLRWWDGSQWTQHTAPLAQQAPQQQVAQPAQAVAQPAQAPRRTEDLVPVKRSKLAWILPIVFVVAALVGSLSAVALWSSGAIDAEPLERTYATYTRAELTKDCATLVAVTTANFRDDLTERPFTCAEWASQRPVIQRAGTPKWGFRMGPVGVLLVEERHFRFLGDEELSGATLTSFTLIREDGRWKIDDAGDDVDGDID
ncbi:DUF2510 domain-containing protein [Aeromicrobium sp. 636]|uniref:DUF2510 domain-containing protein n=1 Tax=Aeromicrobium senzhongii TaxID=2663859 RepID=A0A8I0EVJ1_9ACTN|nr:MULTISPECIES: DUF2510 domain-containing protein [Aeromicrobium]MBC9226324.1 DUF2510 domain-containing protein [Aeromicrobium senzhongii]MCQ3998429.1 DUF2510 domain-containing protein [Aeromicrobium sp. 636]